MRYALLFCSTAQCQKTSLGQILVENKDPNRLLQTTRTCWKEFGVFECEVLEVMDKIIPKNSLSRLLARHASRSMCFLLLAIKRCLLFGYIVRFQFSVYACDISL